MIRELFKDLIKYFPSKLVPAIVGIIAIPIITRLFSPDEYGNYVLVMATVSLLSTLAVAWLNSSTIRFLPAYELSGKVNQFRTVLLKLMLLSIGITFVLFLGILFLLKNCISSNFYSLMRIGIFVFAISSCWSILINFLRARRKAAWYSTFSVWASIAGLGFGILIVLNFDLGVEGLLWGVIICMAIALPFLWKTSIGFSSLRKGNIRSPMSWEIAMYGIPAMMINVLTWAQSLSDRYILEFFCGSVEVGMYSASYAISEKGIFLLSSLVLLAASPIGFNIWESQGVKASQEFMSKLTRYYLLVGLPATVGLSVLAEPIIDVFVAPAYCQGYRIVPLVAFGAFFMGIAHRFTIGLSYHNRTDLLMLCCFGSVVLNIILNFLLIPRYGFMAAAVTTFISYFFLLLLSILVSRRFFVWGFPFKSLAKIICASAVMGVVVFSMGNTLIFSQWVNLGIAACIGAVVYGFLLFLLREIQPNEKKMIKQTLKSVCGRLVSS